MFSSLLNLLTILNCITSAVLGELYEEPIDFKKTIIEHPFMFSANVVIMSFGYILLGGFISGWFHPISDILFNGIMLYANYQCLSSKYGLRLF